MGLAARPGRGRPGRPRRLTGGHGAPASGRNRRLAVRIGGGGDGGFPAVGDPCPASLRRSRIDVLTRQPRGSCTVTATMAPVSMSTPCSALWARCVRPSFIFATFASGSCGDFHSLFDVFLFFRDRSNRRVDAAHRRDGGSGESVPAGRSAGGRGAAPGGRASARRSRSCCGARASGKRPS